MDGWTRYVLDVLALVGDDLSRALPLGGVTPGGTCAGEPPAALLGRVASGDVARARAARRRLARCSPAIVAVVAEVAIPGASLEAVALRVALRLAPAALRAQGERTAREATEAREAARRCVGLGRSLARRSLTDPARATVALQRAHLEAEAQSAEARAHEARGRLVAWGVATLSADVERYDRGEESAA